MLLTIDIGNTLTDFGFFKDETLVERFAIRSDTGKSEDEIHASLSLLLQERKITKDQVEGIVISSVVPSLLRLYLSLSQSIFGLEPKVLGPKLKTGILIDTDDPKEVGADLVADCAGALELYGPACLIADLGTATKIVLLDQRGAFAGCTIGAGLGISLEAMVSKTAVLPEVSMKIPAKIVGKNTVDSMNSALTYGTSLQISALADAIEKEVGYPLKRVLTGGYAQFIEALLPGFTYEPALSLIGLKAIDRRNRK